MSATVLPQLERALVKACRSEQAAAGISDRSWSHSEQNVTRRAPRLGTAVAVLTSVPAVLVVAGGALLLLVRHRSQPTSTPHVAAGAVAQSCRLGAVRRPARRHGSPRGALWWTENVASDTAMLETDVIRSHPGTLKRLTIGRLTGTVVGGDELAGWERLVDVGLDGLRDRPARQYDRSADDTRS
jgi:hypothetical protein